MRFLYWLNRLYDSHWPTFLKVDEIWCLSGVLVSSMIVVLCTIICMAYLIENDTMVVKGWQEQIVQLKRFRLQIKH